MATPTPKDTAEVGRLEHEIAQVRGDLGRTVQEIGTRLTPAHLMEEARRSLKQGTVETTKAVAQSATDVASDVASRTRDVALDARAHVQAHPYAAGAVGAGIGLGYWVVTSAMNRRKRLVPREWDEPFESVEPPGSVEPQGDVERIAHVTADPDRGSGRGGLADLEEPRLAGTAGRTKKGAPRSGRPCHVRRSPRRYDVGFFAPMLFERSCTCWRCSFSVGSVFDAKAFTSASPLVDATRENSRTSFW